VDDAVFGLEELRQVADRVRHRLAGGNHNPDVTRRAQRSDKRFQRLHRLSAFALERQRRRRVAINNDDAVATPDQAAGDVRAHTAEADDAEFHQAPRAETGKLKLADPGRPVSSFFFPVSMPITVSLSCPPSPGSLPVLFSGPCRKV